MNAPQSVRADERTFAVAHKANTWGLNFISFALLIDVVYRGVVLDEAAWDLLALVFASGFISTAYMARHKVLGQVLGWRATVSGMVVAAVVGAATAILATTDVAFGWKVAIIGAAAAIVAAVVSAILAMTKRM